MIATVLDTQTHQTHIDDRADSFQWAENNWSCDCNRWPPNNPGPDTGVCEGGKRFIVIKAEFQGDESRYSLAELNSDYPPELLREHGIEAT